MNQKCIGMSSTPYEKMCRRSTNKIYKSKLHTLDNLSLESTGWSAKGAEVSQVELAGMLTQFCSRELNIVEFSWTNISKNKLTLQCFFTSKSGVWAELRIKTRQNIVDFSRWQIWYTNFSGATHFSSLHYVWWVSHNLVSQNLSHRIRAVMRLNDGFYTPNFSNKSI